ncbi:MAG: DNA replication and repair protein RecF [Paludibacteraceae bacterium]|nr:DNA replication and repair protein RecF [Paludibacteraceae bacterium]
MQLHQLHILNWKNIREADLVFADKLNCLVGLNGQGKTNVLDAIHLLSFTKSAFNVTDSQNISHDEAMAMVQGEYTDVVIDGEEGVSISCGLKRGLKKQFRCGKKDYKRLIDHIGRLPLVMISPEDSGLIAEGSDERRRFMNVVISQQDRRYLECLTDYNALLKQRNALLKQYEDRQVVPDDLLEVFELQMIPPAEYIYQCRSRFIEAFVPVFQEIYRHISGDAEQVSLRYISQLQDRDLREAFVRTRSRDMILGWTSQGVHKDELEMLLQGYPLKRVGSQGQQKTYLLSMKLAQSLYLGKPILLLDDVFDKLDSERVERIIRLVRTERFGQIFITDTDRQHLTDILSDVTDAKIFHVHNGQISE